MRDSAIKHRSLRVAKGLMTIGGAWLFLSPSAWMAVKDSPLKTKKAPTAHQFEFVGRGACVVCHAEQQRLWQGSHHHLSMQIANDHTVLGDFSDAEFSHFGVVSQFYRKKERYWVRTDGSDGRLSEFEIKYTFGFSPLQQYLIELHGGRLQALSIAWAEHKLKPERIEAKSEGLIVQLNERRNILWTIDPTGRCPSGNEA